MPCVVMMNWWINSSILVITSVFFGKMFFGSSTQIGPDGSLSKACVRIRALCRISSMRTR